MTPGPPAPPGPWPPFDVAAARPTIDTLHRWTQIVGKVRMACTPPQNHWWHVTLYVSARGLTTSLIPDRRGGFEMVFDFHRHRLEIQTVEGRERTVALEHRTVADFFAETQAPRRARHGSRSRCVAEEAAGRGGRYRAGWDRRSRTKRSDRPSIAGRTTMPPRTRIPPPMFAPFTGEVATA